jgi:Spy/CpxP family protein refolding chaperone
MKTKDAPTRRWMETRRQGRLRSQEQARMPALPGVMVSALAATLLSVLCVTIFCADTVSAQTLRRRVQRKIGQKTPRPAVNPNTLAPSKGAASNGQPSSVEEDDTVTPDQPEATSPREANRQSGYNLDGIRRRGIRSLFTREEASLWIPGFGNRAALLMIFRQLDLAPEQKGKIRALRQQVGNRLAVMRREVNLLEAQRDEAIYGNLDPASLDSYDPDRVKDLTEQIVIKRADWFRLQTDIESQLRQILTPDQVYVFRELALEMILPGRRNPAARLRRMGIRRNQQNRPNPQSQPD